MTKIYTAEVELAGEEFLFASTENGLAYVGRSGDQEFAAFFPDDEQVADNGENQIAIRQFQEYFAGQRQSFDLQLDLAGTPFQRLVWQQLQQIPFGETVCYSELAASLGRPQSTRAVANAVGRNPVLIAVPCHRVLGKNGKLTGFRSGLPLKITLLTIEGIDSFR